MEPFIPLSIVLSVVGGALSASLTLGNKFSAMDKRNHDYTDKQFNSVNDRVNQIEYRLGKEYVYKDDLSGMLERLEHRMDKMDNKLDQILISYNKSDK